MLKVRPLRVTRVGAVVAASTHALPAALKPKAHAVHAGGELYPSAHPPPTPSRVPGEGAGLRDTPERLGEEENEKVGEEECEGVGTGLTERVSEEEAEGVVSAYE